MSWNREFDEPINLPSGKLLTTLRDAGDYIASLPAKIHAQPQWQTPMAMLITAAKGGPTMFARIGLMKAIMPQSDPIYDPKRKNSWRKASRR
jgi:hypothetical protein